MHAPCFKQFKTCSIFYPLFDCRLALQPSKSINILIIRVANPFCVALFSAGFHLNLAGRRRGILTRPINRTLRVGPVLFSHVGLPYRVSFARQNAQSALRRQHSTLETLQIGIWPHRSTFYCRRVSEECRVSRRDQSGRPVSLGPVFKCDAEYRRVN